MCVTYFVLVWYLIESILCFVANSIKLVCDKFMLCIEQEDENQRLFIQSTVTAGIAIQSLLISLCSTFLSCFYSLLSWHKLVVLDPGLSKLITNGF